ncbi:hypothetical protein [Pseudarthrobacter sp. N5]|uniref:hypothetical protein n=1 Tax=Pseudarthrobacter sp. N5 TaxID=3418416 RepID=UPI003CEBD431
MSQQVSEPMSTGLPAAPVPPEQSPQVNPPLPAWLAAIDARKLWAGGAAAVSSYAIVFIASLAMLLIAFSGIAATNQGEVLPAGSLNSSGQDQPDVWAMVGQLASQLVAMAHLGGLSATMEASVPFLGSIRAGASAFVVPLSVLAVSMISIYSTSWLAERRLPSGSRMQLVAQSLVTGVVYAAVVNVVAAASALKYPAASEITVSPVTAAGFWPVVIAFVIGVALSKAARNRASAGIYGPSRLAASARLFNLPVAVVSSHLLVFAAVSIPALLIIAAVANGLSGLLTAPLWVLNGVGLALVAGHLGGLSVFTAGRQFTGGNVNSASDYVFYGLDGTASTGMAIGALALTIICTLISGTVLILRRGQADNSRIAGWFGVPAAYLVLGMLLLPLLSSSAVFNVGALAKGEFSLAPAWWSPAVFLAWGLLVELISRFVSPYFLPFVPAALRRLARMRVPVTPPVPVDADAPVPLLAQGKTGTVAPESREGASLATGSQVMPVEPAAKILTPAGRKRAGMVVAGAGLALTLGIGGLVAVNVVRSGNGPDKVVGAYLQALVEGDAEKAMSISDPDVPMNERALLTNEIYKAAGQRIDGYTVLSTEVSGNAASVRVELRQDGRRTEVPFTLSTGEVQVLDDDWRLKSNRLNTVFLSANADVGAFAVNGVTVNIADKGQPGSRTVSLPAFPGEYTVGIPASEQYVSAQERRIQVQAGTGAQAPHTATLQVTASKELEREAAKQIDAFLTACAASTELRPKGCPFVSYEFSDTRNVKWAISEKPQYSLEQSYDGGWRIATKRSGNADVSYERNASYMSDKPDWKPEKDAVAFSVNGTVRVDSGTVVAELSHY